MHQAADIYSYLICINSGVEKLPFTRKKTPAAPELSLVQVTIYHDRLRFQADRAEIQNEHQNVHRSTFSTRAKEYWATTN